MSGAPLLWLALACADSVKPTVVASPVVLDASLVQSRVPAQQPLILRACVSVSQPGWSWSPGFPEVEGLTGGEVQSQAQGAVSCLERPYSGEAGSYVFPPVQVQAQGAQGEPLTLESAQLFGDIGEGLAQADLGALSAQPDRRWFKKEMDWRSLWVGIPMAVIGSLFGLWLVRVLGRKPTAAVPALPPGAQALQDWQIARDDPKLSDQEKGQALSRITRRYLTHIGAPQALKRTTDELVAELEGDPRLGQWCGVLGHLLRAADTVKFAGGVASAGLLDQWSEGLESLVKSQRPAPPPEQI